MRSALLVVSILLPAVAFAQVGEVTTLEGEASRTPAGGQAVALAEGSPIELGDTLEVKRGSLAIRLDDESTLMLAEGSKLRIDEARFGALERHFSAKLLLGSVWAAVTHALEGGSSFEVSTERAAAGVRGTVFRVDVAPDAQGALQTEVSVEDGKVAVRALAPAGAAGTASEALLTRGQGLRIGRRLFQRFAAAVRAGSFERFVRRHRAAALERRRQKRRRRIQRRRR